MSFIVQNFIGGLENQLFMLLNIISLSIDYNIDFYLNIRNFDFNRKNFTYYKLFQNNNLKRIILNNLNNYNIINQDGLRYNKIILHQDTHYLLDKGESGYFQCWKFFWHKK
jgi:hypothetical protein